MSPLQTTLHRAIHSTHPLDLILSGLVLSRLLNSSPEGPLYFSEVFAAAETAAQDILCKSLRDVIVECVGDELSGHPHTVDAALAVYLHRLCERVSELRNPTLPCAESGILGIVQLVERERARFMELDRLSGTSGVNVATDRKVAEAYETAKSESSASLRAKLGLELLRKGGNTCPRTADEWAEAEVILRETMLQSFLLWAKRRGYRVTEGVDVVDPQMSLNTKWAIVGHAHRIVSATRSVTEAALT
ncbi:hypothetical protein [Pelagibius sp. 7325]|uniref:hypothetical protein n=1 Tax=Pelagibius sp. 7325 TaxID=3131994 RepID=UPI0030EE33C4